MLRAHGYFRSGASWRLRIALNLKGIEAEQAYVHLRKGEQSAPSFRALNPEGLVPVLEHNGEVLTQSLAIIEYLDEIQSNPPLLPPAPADRAFVRAIALAIASDIHPLDNLRVLSYLKDEFNIDDAGRNRWYAHWIAVGFASLEGRLARDRRVGRFCFGDTPTLADVCLIPQMGNAERMNCPLDAYPTLQRIRAAALALPAFAAAAPDVQPDAG
ncbi:MAG TPA: maleylacetoacetate isomerase [Casimicrobiaceae bacterium]|nr:maleylacetoacetate isomerase [Casimicrobiaceae bacterium]